MKLNIEKPASCHVQAVGHLVTDGTRTYDTKGNVLLICGDRNFNLPISKEHKRGIEFDDASYEREELVALVSEVVCGFCVYCPNNLPPID